MFAAGGPRNALLTSKGLSNPWLVEIPIEEKPQSLSFKFFPNPAQNEMLLNFEYNDSWMGKTISIVDINGVVVSRVQVTAKSQKINLASLKAGMYFILGQNTDQKLRAKFIKL